MTCIVPYPWHCSRPRGWGRLTRSLIATGHMTLAEREEISRGSGCHLLAVMTLLAHHIMSGAFVAAGTWFTPARLA